MNAMHPVMAQKKTETNEAISQTKASTIKFLSSSGMIFVGGCPVG